MVVSENVDEWAVANVHALLKFVCRVPALPGVCAAYASPLRPTAIPAFLPIRLRRGREKTAVGLHSRGGGQVTTHSQDHGSGSAAYLKFGLQFGSRHPRPSGRNAGFELSGAAAGFDVPEKAGDFTPNANPARRGLPHLRDYEVG
jgi:hypothetical protein